MKCILLVLSAVCLICFASCPGTDDSVGSGPETGKDYKVKVASDALPSDVPQSLKSVFSSAATALFSDDTVNIGLTNNQKQEADYSINAANSVTITIGGVSLKCWPRRFEAGHG